MKTDRKDVGVPASVVLQPLSEEMGVWAAVNAKREDKNVRLERAMMVRLSRSKAFWRSSDKLASVKDGHRGHVVFLYSLLCLDAVFSGSIVSYW